MKNLRAGEPVAYKVSIGGGYYVSITSGFYCIDIRKFFVPYGETDVKPTRQGIALRLREWGEMRKIIDTINNTYPSLATALPCYLSDDHQNQMGALQCRECYPFCQDTYL